MVFIIDDTPAHAHQHAYGGVDPITPEMIKAMSGSVWYTSGSIKDITQSGKYCVGPDVADMPYENSWWIADVGYSSGNCEITVKDLFYSDYVYTQSMANGNWNGWKHLATTDNAVMKKDKPSGSYTGNGDAAARTIDTGGVGKAVLIYSGYGLALVTRIISAAWDASDGGALAGQAAYADGVLTLATTNTMMNAAGATYYYQVL